MPIEYVEPLGWHYLMLIQAVVIFGKGFFCVSLVKCKVIRIIALSIFISHDQKMIIIYICLKKKK